MTVIEQVTEINDVIKDIFDFIQNNETVNPDFNKYLSTIGARDISLNQMEKIFLPYIFERRLGDDAISVLELFLNENKKYKKIVSSFLQAQNSIFEIKKVLKNGFELYNLVNEKSYTVLSLTKMTNFRGIYSGQYIVARIFEYNDEHYIIEISSVLTHSQKDEVTRYAIMKLIEDPSLLYLNNKDKETEIKTAISDMYEKFIKAFGTDIIITTNKYADEIIGSFYEDETIDLTDKQPNFETYKFFHVKELENNYSNFLENSMRGFGGHSETYDIAIFFDKDSGLYTIPFYETLTKYIEGCEIENPKGCIEYFLQNNSIPVSVLQKLNTEHKDFMQKVNSTLGAEYTFDELVSKYKSFYQKKKIYSPATTLYHSKVFNQMSDVMLSTSQEESTSAKIVAKVGRNEPCPCGSGKKYKNCCGK